MKWSLYLGKIAGIKVFIHWTFLLLVIWVFFLNARNGLEASLWNVLFIITVFACVTLHELGHALAARKFNFKTRDITLLPIGGLARMESLPENPRQELIVAFAGPLVNLVISGLLLIILYPTGSFPDSSSLIQISAENFAYALMVVNLILALFNLIPAFPMDGGRMLRALLSFRMSRQVATNFAASVGQLLAILFALIGLFHNPFLIIIGIFVYLGAQAEAQDVTSKTILKGHYVRDLLMHHYFTLKPGNTIGDAIALLLDSDAREFLVLDQEQVVGTLDRSHLIKGLAQSGEDTLISEIMSEHYLELAPDMPLEKVYQLHQQQKLQGLMPVLQAGELIGVLDLENIMEYITIQKVLEKRLVGG